MSNKVGDIDEEKPYGKPLTYDKNFKGPIKDRSCTDIICCLLFLIFIVGLVVVAFFAFKYGDPRLLVYPVNSNNEICGYGNQLGKPYLLFFDLVACGRMGMGVFVTGCPTPQICVASCPTENNVIIAATDTKSDLKYCKDGFDAVSSSKSIANMLKDEDCATYWFKSQPCKISSDSIDIPSLILITYLFQHSLMYYYLQSNFVISN